MKNNNNKTIVTMGGENTSHRYLGTQKEYEDLGIIANVQLRSLGIRIANDPKGSLKFVVPKALEANLKRVYNFSIEELNVGVDQPLSELARHVDQQSAMEARTGIVAEFLRHYLNQLKLKYDVWYNNVFYKSRQLLGAKGSDKVVNAYVLKKYSKRYTKYNSAINEAEFAYRLVNSGIRAAWITKGRLLQTLRVIVQGSNRYTGIMEEEQEK